MSHPISLRSWRMRSQNRSNHYHFEEIHITKLQYGTSMTYWIKYKRKLEQKEMLVGMTLSLADLVKFQYK